MDTINSAKKFCKKNGRIIVVGIASTVLPQQIYKDTGIYPHEGLLDKPGCIDADDTTIIDKLPPEYSILEEIEYKYSEDNAMARGCPRSCAFCAVSHRCIFA